MAVLTICALVGGVALILVGLTALGLVALVAGADDERPPVAPASRR